MASSKNVAIMIKNLTVWSGTERAVVNLANILASEGFNIHIISMNSSESDKCPYEIHERVKVFHVGLNPASIPQRVLHYVKFISRTRKYLRENNINVLMGTGHQYNCMMYILGRGIKKIACEHLNYQICPKYSNVVRKFIYPKLDAVVCLTKGDAGNYLSFMRPEKVHVIPNSLPFERNARSDLSVKRVIAVGRLTAQKNFQALIEAAALIKPSLPEWHIDIFGQGEDEEKLINMIAAERLEDYVTIHKPVHDIKREYLASGILAATSIYEGLPMILIEGAACGLPIVSFNCNYGPSDLIQNGVNGFLVDVGDIQGVAEKIITIAKDSELQNAMGLASFEKAEHYELKNVKRMWLELLNKI